MKAMLNSGSQGPVSDDHRIGKNGNNRVKREITGNIWGGEKNYSEGHFSKKPVVPGIKEKNK